MYELRQALEAIRDFMEMGGPVLTAIAWLLFVMWIMIVERWAFYRSALKTQINEVVGIWEARSERKSIVKEDAEKIVVNSALMYLVIEEIEKSGYSGLSSYKNRIATTVDRLTECLNRH